ncbi:MAG TPA: arginine--tRNA ligase [Candidatus Saccharimonadales bacterium]|nr:arginine--tRNA ligase [Candidatus Saccharimonadales bacterium]
MQKELVRALKQACQKLFSKDIEPEVSRPDEQFGDYATNTALQLAKILSQHPRLVAEKLAEELRNNPDLKEAIVAGPGFINFKLTDDKLQELAGSATNLPKPLEGQEILVEFGDPNPFKEMHIGHLYSYIVGDTISNILTVAGANVKRLSYHGDVGRQVAQAMWGMRQINVTDDISLGQAYATGAKAYEEDEQAKAEIDDINRHVYEQDDPAINELHQKGVKLSFEYFDKILNLLSISTDKRYLESQSTPVGLELVKNNTGKVFRQSQGAVVYEGEKAGLHTRVFITSQGLPTYESKDLGLVMLKDRDYPGAGRSVVITATEQAEYFKVMLSALAEIKPELAAKTTHLSHGFVSLKSGKMSSRTGEVYTAAKLLNAVKQVVDQQYPDSKVKDEIYLSAVKFSFLNHRLGSDMVFDVKESVSLEGNSGPYLQYAYARARSILAKAEGGGNSKTKDMDSSERSLARKISEYPEVVEKAVTELMPHHICIYLYELAQTFNGFYEKSRIIGDERQNLRLDLVKSYSQVLASGLSILNISAPERI